MDNKKYKNENTDTKGKRKRVLLKCPSCDFPFFVPKKTVRGHEAIIKKIETGKPYFFGMPVLKDFTILCPKCGKTCHVKLEPIASISFLINYLRRILYRLEKEQKLQNRRKMIKK